MWMLPYSSRLKLDENFLFPFPLKWFFQFPPQRFSFLDFSYKIISLKKIFLWNGFPGKQSLSR